MKRANSLDPITREFMQYLWLKEDIKRLQEQEAKIKKSLIKHVEEHGEVDEEKGHLTFPLGTSITVDDTSFSGFMKQKRVSQSFNEDRAKALCESKEIAEEEYTSTEIYVDQDKIARLFAEERLTEEEFDSLIDRNESYAFVSVKAD